MYFKAISLISSTRSSLSSFPPLLPSIPSAKSKISLNTFKWCSTVGYLAESCQAQSVAACWIVLQDPCRTAHWAIPCPLRMQGWQGLERRGKWGQPPRSQQDLWRQTQAPPGATGRPGCKFLFSVQKRNYIRFLVRNHILFLITSSTILVTLKSPTTIKVPSWVVGCVHVST